MPLTAFEEKLALNEERLEILRLLSINSTKLSKSIKQLGDMKAQLSKARTSTARCLALTDFLLNKAKVVLLIEYDRAKKILSVNKNLIPDMEQEISDLNRSIKFLEEEVAFLKKRLMEIDKKLTTFGKVIHIHARRQQKASGT